MDSGGGVLGRDWEGEQDFSREMRSGEEEVGRVGEPGDTAGTSICGVGRREKASARKERGEERKRTRPTPVLCEDVLRSRCDVVEDDVVLVLEARGTISLYLDSLRDLLMELTASYPSSFIESQTICFPSGEILGDEVAPRVPEVSVLTPPCRPRR